MNYFTMLACSMSRADYLDLLKQAGREGSEAVHLSQREHEELLEAVEDNRKPQAGDRYRHGNGSEYILGKLGVTTYALVNLQSGLFWSPFVKSPELVFGACRLVFTRV